jgi:hypothetical protein
MALSIGFRSSVSFPSAIQATELLTFAPVGLSPTEHASFSWTHPDLLFYPVSDVGETPARVADREVLHPTAQDRVDLLNHPTHRLGARDPEDLFEFAQQGRPFLAFRQQQRHPSSPTTPDTTELKPEKSETLPSL